MTSFLSVCMSLGLLSPTVTALPAGPDAKLTPVVKTVNDDATMASTETIAALSRTAGPFGSYISAADYADYLELEYGYYTRVIRSSNGWYYVIYW
jgi:hypothetical protein